MKRTSSKIKSKTTGTLAPIDFRECVLETPAFLIQLQEHENVISSAAKEMKTIRKNLRAVVKNHQELSANMKLLSASLRKYQYNYFEATSEDEIQIGQSLMDYSSTFDQVERLRSDLIASLNGDLQSLEESHKCRYTILAEKKKRYEKELGKADKMTETFVKSTVQPDDLIRNTQLQRSLLNTSATDYVMTINLTHSFNKLGFFEMMFVVFSQFRSFSQLMGDTFKDQDDLINRLQTSLQNANRDVDAANQRVLVEMEETTKNPYKSEDGSVCGYLHVEEKANKKKLQFAAGVKRIFCKYEKSTCLLHRQDVSDKTSDNILVGRCRRSLSNIFAFDVFTESTADFSTYIVLTEAEFSNWCNVLGIPTETTQIENTESHSNFTLDEHSLFFVNECIRIIETCDVGLDFVGIHRIEGSQERKRTLLELGANPNTFDRFIKLTENSNCQIDVTSCMKAYLRSLNPCIISKKVLSILRLLIEHCDNLEKQIEFFTLVLSNIPKVQREVLKSVLNHLRRVSLNSDVNMMSLDNLAMCFAPSIVYFEMNTLNQLNDMPRIFKVIKICIENSDRILMDLTEDMHTQLNSQLSEFMREHADSIS